MELVYRQESLQDSVVRIRNIGEILMPYTYPLAPKSLDEVSFLKLNEMMIDGYELYIQYNKSDYEDYFLESVEIIGKNAPFLPFVVVCKIAKAFLGSEYLSYLHFFGKNRRHYCWTLAKDMDDHPIPALFKIDLDVERYEGLEYTVLPIGTIDFH